MNRKLTRSNVSFLETARIAIETSTKHPEIKQALADVCYSEAELAQGAALLKKATKAFHASLTESNESSAAYRKFLQAEKALIEMYKPDRAKAKVIFRTEAIALRELGLDTFQPRSYDRWLLSVENFYTRIEANAAHLEAVARLAITPERITSAQEQIVTLKEARRVYLSERGESMDATKTKDQAIGELDRWMSDFWVVARIALKDRPQLLESLGKYVRN